MPDATTADETLSVRMPKALLNEMKSYGAAEKRSLGFIVRDAVEAYLRRAKRHRGRPGEES